jgi:DNA (cytosine-5)-methyltransferase 1
MSLTHLDLFSGIGGFSLAAEAVGFHTIGFSEIDPYASAILKKHWPDIKNYGDITTADFSDIGNIDLLTGGFPCQPFSVAGKQRGKEDPRHLWPSMLRIIAQVKPRFIVGENVTGIVNMELDQMLVDLENISYSTWPIIIPACSVNAPHRRDRVWILANSMRPRSETRLSGPLQGKERFSGITDNSCAKPNGWEDSWVKAATEFCGVDDGLPNRVDRLKCLGNSVVPQVAQIFLREIYNQAIS